MNETKETTKVGVDDLPKLRKAYDKAVKKGETIFEFKGAKLLVSNAKYLIQYLDWRSKVS